MVSSFGLARRARPPRAGARRVCCARSVSLALVEGRRGGAREGRLCVFPRHSAPVAAACATKRPASASTAANDGVPASV